MLPKEGQQFLGLGFHDFGNGSYDLFSEGHRNTCRSIETVAGEIGRVACFSSNRFFKDGRGIGVTRLFCFGEFSVAPNVELEFSPE